MLLPKLLDNINERVLDHLKDQLCDGSKVSIAAASFSIYAYEALKEELEDIEELRFIFTSPTFIKNKVKKEKRESMVNVMPSPFAEEYLKIFNEQWHNADKFKDVTSQVLEYIETVYNENAPEFIYFIALYNIFNEFLDDISEDVLPNEATGFKSSVIWSKLYNFQKDAALAIINKLEKYNGCILADSVGLGKTFTALSVIKYYENRNKSVLVLCPKKLYDNWSTFKTNYKNNPLVGDRLRYDILFHSDLSRERGMSAGIDLERINWGNYDLIVIDESHNFRNGGNIDEDEENFDLEDGEKKKENRYLSLRVRLTQSQMEQLDTLTSHKHVPYISLLSVKTMLMMKVL